MDIIKMRGWLFVALLLAVAVPFLFFNASGDSRKTRILKLLDKGMIGGLTGEQTAMLFNTVTIVKNEAGIDEPVLINTPFRDGYLHVYTTTPEVQDVTGCGRGNAVYDVKLNAIFIDQSFINPWQQSRLAEKLGVPNYLKVMSGYFHYVLLHEMGHRALHREEEDLHEERLRQMEDEADDFAFAHLDSLYNKYWLESQVIAGGYFADNGGMDWVNSEEMMELGNVHDRMTLDLVVPLSILAKSMFQPDSPFSVFQTDNAHRSFVEKALHILERIRKLTDVDAALMYRFAVLNELLTRMKGVQQNNIFSIDSPDWIQHVSSDSGRVKIISANNETFEISFAEVEQQLKAGKDAYRLTYASRQGKEKIADWMVQRLAQNGLSTFGENPHSAFRTAGAEDTWFIDMAHDLAGSELKVLSQSQFFEDEDGSKSSYHLYSLMKGEKVLDTVREENLVAEAQKQTGMYMDIYSSVNICNGVVYFHNRQYEVADADTVARTVMIKCKPGSLQIDSVLLFRLPPMTEKVKRIKYVCRNEGVPRAFMLSLSDSSWKLWGLSSDLPAQLLYEKKVLLQEALSNAKYSVSHAPEGYKDGTLDKETGTSICSFTYADGHVLMNFENDSYYRYNVSRKELGTVFHLGGEEIMTVPLPGQYFGIYALNGKKIFVIRK
jgi:hypothetical protein